MDPFLLSTTTISESPGLELLEQTGGLKQEKCILSWSLSLEVRNQQCLPLLKVLREDLCHASLAWRGITQIPTWTFTRTFCVSVHPPFPMESVPSYGSLLYKSTSHFGLGPHPILVILILDLYLKWTHFPIRLLSEALMNRTLIYS